MVTLNTPGERKSVNLLISTFDRNMSADGKLQHLDMQIDHRDPRGTSQTNPHLVSTPVPVGGQIRQNHARAYTVGSYAALQGAAGHFRGEGSAPILNATGEPEGQLIAVKADIVSTIHGGYAIDLRGPMAASDYPVDAMTWASQRAATREARAALERDPSLIMEIPHDVKDSPTASATGTAPGKRRALKAPTAEDLSAMGRIGHAAADGARAGVKIGKAVPKVGAVLGGSVGAVIGAGNGVAKEADRRLGKDVPATPASTPAAPAAAPAERDAEWDPGAAFGAATRGFGTHQERAKSAAKPAPALITGLPEFAPGKGDTGPEFG